MFHCTELDSMNVLTFNECIFSRTCTLPLPLHMLLTLTVCIYRDKKGEKQVNGLAVELEESEEKEG